MRIKKTNENKVKSIKRNTKRIEFWNKNIVTVIKNKNKVRKWKIENKSKKNNVKENIT